jgi:alpha-glucosidase (family GH31 glycosyl hydrolase)
LLFSNLAAHAHTIEANMKTPFGMLITCLFIIAAALAPPCARPAGAIEKSNIPPVSPDWVFDHWVWEDDANTQQAVMDLVDSYASHGIPVGAVIVDSPWSTEYNNFVWNKENYPDPQGMIDALHKRGIKVVPWMTSMINSETPGGNFEPKTSETYKEALAKGYLANGGTLTKWWKGLGGFVDYTNPGALDWWHGLMDRVLLMGIDGWKVDGSDMMFPANGFGKAGKMGPFQYQDLYYTDTYEHTLERNKQGIIMSRAVDLKIVAPRGYTPISHAPVTWVGDQRHDWTDQGFIEALQNIFDSAKLGYAVIGSDTAGYNGDMEISKNLLIRWTQFSSLCPFFENGGHGKHQPWLHDDETLAIYKKFVDLHSNLKPYFYSMMMRAHLGKGPIMRPVKGKWQYKLGGDLFVSVIYEDTLGREVTFPDGEWLDYWDNAKTFKGGETVSYAAQLDTYPLFVRRGAIIPMYLQATDYGDPSLKDGVTLDIYPGEGAAQFDVYEPGREKVPVTVTATGGKLDVKISNTGGRNYYLCVHSKGVGAVKAGGKAVSEVYPEGLGHKKNARVSSEGRVYIAPEQKNNIDVQIMLR